MSETPSHSEFFLLRAKSYNKAVFADIGYPSAASKILRKIALVVKIREIKTFFKGVFYVGRVGNGFAGLAADKCND